MPLTVPKSMQSWVGVELSPRFCSTSEPWRKTFTISPRWKPPTCCRCCRPSSVVAALTVRREAETQRGERAYVMKRRQDRSKEEISNHIVQT